MTTYYSATTNSFFDSRLHGANMPSDVVPITQERHQELLQSQGEFQITPDENGHPTLVPFVPDPLPWATKRARAYPPIGDQLDMIFHEGIDA